jgi:NAD(P)-dependent dehydrogenase (short-subunit alcohol dehydrogenase family)
MPHSKRTVVVTGASSGIGRASVEKMSRSGWHVFATVRKTSDQDELRKLNADITPVIMDVEDGASISAGAKEIEAQLDGRGLDGLVNCAGIGMVRPVEYAKLDDIRRIFEINVFGQIAVTQAFAHLLRKNRGRIVNVTSVGVNIAIPFGGLLNASKSAFGMLSDSLRMELRPFGVRVIAVEPGSIATPAVNKTLGDMERVIEDLPPEAQSQYGDMLRSFARVAYAREKAGSSPDVVARTIYRALTSSRPRIRYRVGQDAKLLSILPKLLPESVMDAIRLRMFGLVGPSVARAHGQPRPGLQRVPSNGRA